jgi:hypothetical protein
MGDDRDGRDRSRSPDRRHDRRGDERRDERQISSRDDNSSRRDRRDDDSRALKGKGRDDYDNRRRSRSRSRSPARNRSRSRSHSRERHSTSRHGHSRRRSRSVSESSSGSDTEDSRDRRHRKKKEKRAKEKSSGGLDSKGRDKDERRARKQEKKDKKERKERKKKGLKVVEWGKHGIINETGLFFSASRLVRSSPCTKDVTRTDIYTKDQEFRAWLVEERTLNPEVLPKNKMKDEFKSFMEEYNTGKHFTLRTAFRSADRFFVPATFNSDKFYDIAKFEARMNAVRMGETVASTDTYDANADMEGKLKFCFPLHYNPVANVDVQTFSGS